MAQVPGAKKYIAFRYMTRFQCLGGDCEDTCCQQWHIFVGESQYKRLKRTMAGSEAERALFRAAVERNDNPNRTRHSFAVLRHREDDDHCVLLDGEGLCSLHRRYGEKLLPHICSQFPRAVTRVGERVELLGTLSCPETARLSLLPDDGMDLVEIDHAMIPRDEVDRSMLARPATPWEAHLDDIRGTAYEILSQRRYPIAERLFFFSWFARTVEPFFHPEARDLDPARLDEAMRSIGDPALLGELSMRFRMAEAPVALWSSFTIAFLAARLDPEGLAARWTLIQRIGASYEEQLGPGRSLDAREAPSSVTPAELAGAYRGRVAGLPAVWWQRVDHYLENYCKNHCMVAWYIDAVSLTAYVQDLITRTSLLRFLLGSHPGLPEAVAIADPGSRERAFDRIAVEAVYTFSRFFEHSRRALETLMSSLVERNMLSLAHTVALLKM